MLLKKKSKIPENILKKETMAATINEKNITYLYVNNKWKLHNI